MRYDYRDGDQTREFDFPMGEAPPAVGRWRRVYAMPGVRYGGGREAFHDSTLEADRRWQRWCLQDAGVPDEAIQPAWRRELV